MNPKIHLITDFFKKTSKTDYFKQFLIFSNPFGAWSMSLGVQGEFLGARRESFLQIESLPKLEEGCPELETCCSELGEGSSEPGESHFCRLDAARSSKRVARFKEYVSWSSERVALSLKWNARSSKRVSRSLR